jgi:hypothetical protein
MAQNIKTFTGATPSYNYLYGYEWLDLQAPAGNVSFTVSNFPTLGTVQGFFRQDETGGRTLTINGKAISVDPAAGAVTWWGMAYDGTTYHATSNYIPAGTGSTLPQLTTPGSFAATAVSSTQVNLSWTDVANDSGYKLYRNTANDFATATLITTTAAGATSYSDTGRTYSTQYYYWIVAAGDGTTYSDSAYATASATTTGLAVLSQNFDAVTPPAIPSGMFVSGGGTLTSANAQSGANVFQFNEDAVVERLGFDTLVATEGTVTFKGKVRAGATSGLTQFSLAMRASSNSAFAGTTLYAMSLNFGYSGGNIYANGVSLKKMVSGTMVDASPTGTPYVGWDALSLNAWYEMEVQISGTTSTHILCVLKRLSDNMYLTSSGTWSGSAQPCVDFTDSTSPISASGYFYMYSVTEANNTPTNEVDDLSLNQA